MVTITMKCLYTYAAISMTAISMMSQVCNAKQETKQETKQELKQVVEKAVFRDVNILVVTDTHSWLAGHMHNDQMPSADATIGNITSFVSTMKKQAALEGKDVFFFDNGDVIDGTGLSNASPIDGQELFPLLMEIPFDALAIGNHECYDESTLKEMISSGYISSRNGTYLSSNVYIADTMAPIASRYTIVVGANSGIRLLTFGILYDMTDNADFVYIQTVEEMIKTDWFITALTEEKYDAIVVLAHMHYEDPLVGVILNAIRATTSAEIPIQFLTGNK
jgi:2',3'-cyclic-nucleotide 2'-phosphodiesterase (5'-nucleotidase family)